MLDHCRVVGYVAKAILDFLPSPVIDRIGDNPVLAASLHDVGKVSPGFQLKYFREALARLGNPLANCHAGFDDNHAAVGELTLASVYGKDGLVPAVAQVAGAHHGSRRENFQHTDLDYTAEGAAWRTERRHLIRRLAGEFGELGCQPADNLSVALLTGLVCVSDWIGSDESFFNRASLAANADLAAMAAEALRRCGWHKLDLRPGLTFEEVFGFSAHPAQRDVIDRIRQPGLFILEAPTGTGKTEAALFAAYRLISQGSAAGFYFGLPTRLTSDRIHLRASGFLSRIARRPHAVRLAHGTAWLSRLKLEAGSGNWRYRESLPEAWFNPGKRALLYPCAVGTIDQSLLAVLNVRHFFLRLFGLAGKVVILDEVHTYDIFTGTHLKRLIELLRQLDCTVIVLTATLTSERRGELLAAVGHKTVSLPEAYPLLTASQSQSCECVEPPPPENRFVRMRMAPWSALEVAQNAVAKAQAGACVLCIANTVAQAQQWYCATMAEMPEAACEVGLLHSKFTGEGRAATEERWMSRLGKDGRRPDGCILIATQVVEQSVDIDADFLISELAPTDMLIQRLGRLWRHRRTRRPLVEPELVVVANHLPTDAEADALCEALGMANTYVYSSYVLCRSHEVWRQLDGQQLSLPQQVRELLRKTYEEMPDEPIAWQELRRRQETRSESLLRRANAVQIGSTGMPVGRDDERAATRYSDRPMREVLLVRGWREERDTTEIELLTGDTLRLPKYGFDVHSAARLRSSIVEMPHYALPQISPPLWLQVYVGAAAAILTCGEDGDLRHDGRDTGFAYDRQRGLLRIVPKDGGKTCQTRVLDKDYFAYTDFEAEDFCHEFGDW